ncbi:CPBP family intramembrane glutamic endopeptidase [Pseudonocardia sp. ICBG601]|uniref:CPBP family glutamic-type intramembrane protease n=1 Tax=Pseudonocardia sp. ICBG601 TaxID=2846759 RepID=UPI001CF6F168|nr:CPBP family intramembrane glutamic endopeptidase [Pseudonocardia sp. ICBG601]
MLPGAYLGPIASALVVTAVADGRPGLRRWLARMWRWRVGGRWYAITLLGVPAAMLATGYLYSGGQIATPSIMVLAAYLPVLLLQMITTGLAEEPGWRDFALPRVQRRFGPFGGTMLLGPIWALWHAPLFLTEWGGWPEASWTRPVAFLIFCLGFNVVMTWIFNRTGESLPLAMLAHVGVNTFASVMWTEMFPTLDGDLAMHAMATGAVVAAVAILCTTRGRLGYTGPVEHRISRTPRRGLNRPVVWTSLVLALSVNATTSVVGLPVVLSAAFGLAALGLATLLTHDHYRRRSAPQ